MCDNTYIKENNNKRKNTMLTQQEITEFIDTLWFEDYIDCCEAIEMAYPCGTEEFDQVQDAFEEAYEIWETLN